MSNKIASFREVIGLWPSLGEFAQDIGVVENTAKLMRFRDSIHSKYWVKIVDSAKTRKIKGISLVLLASIQLEKKVAKAA